MIPPTPYDQEIDELQKKRSRRRHGPRGSGKEGPCEVDCDKCAIEEKLKQLYRLQAAERAANGSPNEGRCATVNNPNGCNQRPCGAKWNQERSIFVCDGPDLQPHNIGGIPGIPDSLQPPETDIAKLRQAHHVDDFGINPPINCGTLNSALELAQQLRIDALNTRLEVAVQMIGAESLRANELAQQNKKLIELRDQAIEEVAVLLHRAMADITELRGEKSIDYDPPALFDVVRTALHYCRTRLLKLSSK